MGWHPLGFLGYSICKYGTGGSGAQERFTVPDLLLLGVRAGMLVHLPDDAFQVCTRAPL